MSERASAIGLATIRSWMFMDVNIHEQRLETKKSTGLDNLPSRMLKIAAGVVAPSLAFLFNQSIPSGIVPTRVTPIFKEGKRQDVNNYRPISIILAVAKVLID